MWYAVHPIRLWGGEYYMYIPRFTSYLRQKALTIRALKGRKGPLIPLGMGVIPGC